ncbi:MAG: hypothetical protein WBG73_24125 [Coleofasciculaceae cyanobacterium]
MSQEVSTNPRANKQLSSSKSVQPWSAESDADKLMDDLFSDIDRILDGGSKLPTEPVKPEYVSLQSIVMPELPTPSAGIATQELVPSYDLPEVEQPPIEATLVQTTTPTVIPQAKRSGWSIEKWLLAGGIISLLVALGLLVANQQKIRLPGFLNFSGSSSSEQLPAEDTQFVSYMLRSLQVIENKNKNNEKTATATNATNNQAPVALPTLPAVGSRSPVPNQPPQVLERIYIPVYPPQAPVAQNINPPTARAAVPAPKPAAKAPAKAPAPAARQSAPAPVKSSTPVKPSAPAPVKQPAPTPVAKLAPPPVMPELPPAPAPSAVESAASVSAAPTEQHTLVGLMESDERSAALFDIDGSTQRFYIGEGIGASGWILVSVANQEAMIRRNGEVRSVYVGQKF